ncbi:MAG TPA: carboxypeptidase regulatory-like domain-containing protein [Oleiagrimonas sp.]|nr:carboxypeptidase regulatory-like domain-containing protein [Oleiagrimonas sp.]
MTNRIRKGILPFAIASLLAASPAVMAQNVTSSSVTGVVVDASGAPVSGATVTIVNQPSGTTKVTTTDANGRYNAQGLRVGGPYEITVSKAGMAQGERGDVYLQLGQVSAINLKMAPSEQNAQELATVTVSANALSQTFNPDNKGLSTNISAQQMAATPSGDRSIADIARLDPRITVNRTTGAISAGGLNNRFNDISVDGVTVGDPFGLNANGLPYQNSAISPDTIAEYNISTSNYDVSSDVVGASINAVTKSGTNEFHGSIYYAYHSASKLVGDAGWLDSDNPGYNYKGYSRDWTGGITLGGPIIKDKLFFFVSAEQQQTEDLGADSANGLDYSLGNGPSTDSKISPGDLQKIIDIAKGLGMQPGTFGGSTGVTLKDKRYLAKIDWNISNNHRASLSYNRTRENHPVVQGNSSDSIGLSSYNYVQSIKNDNISLQFFDDWNTNFSTQAKVGYQHFVQDTNAPAQQPQVDVSIAGYGTPIVHLGEDQYRHYNAVDTKKTSFFFAGTYYAGDHTIKGGIYYERNKIYNLFGRTEFGQYSFDSIGQFASGDYYQYNLYQPAAGYDINDVAAQWTYSQLSPFIQDTWQVNYNLSVMFGIRVNIPHADHKPVYNEAFEKTFGYPNNNSLGSKNKVVEPRLSFNYSFDTERMTQLHGGFGIFQSFPPTVWMTNPYQNNGVTVSTYRSYDPSSAPFSSDPHNQPIPSTSNTIMDVDTIAPNFKLPTVYKFTLALDHELPWWGMIGSIQAQEVRSRNAILYQAVNIGEPTGKLPDGRLQFWKNPGAYPHASGQRPNANANPDFATLSTLLTNTSKGKSDSLTLLLRKPFTNNWSASASFTLSHATEVNPGNSSQASSGYKYVARENPNDNVNGIAERNIPRSVKLSFAWRHAFFGDYYTQVSAFYVGHDGLPYTWIFNGDVNGDGISYEDPVYIPTMNDPKVFFADYKGDAASPELIQQFQNFVSGNSYLNSHRGSIAKVNSAHAPWVSQLDVSFKQEVPGFFKGSKGEIRLDIYNFLNLLNKDWGHVRYLQYDTRGLANYGGVNANGQYIYELPTDRDGNFSPDQYSVQDAGYNPVHVISRWSAMLTLRYTF